MSKLNLHEIDEILEKYQQEEAIEDEVENLALSDQDIEKVADGRIFSLENYKKQFRNPRIV
ncbi:MAG: hypothetical protein K0S11_586 [Gammaproteobacteria bacterium]|jgi:hypothetical protein|nr:hypothetical protein [Gammaproteobacteria bacterium]